MESKTRKNYGVKTANGEPVFRARLYREGEYWRWGIITVSGRKYVDGGDFRTRAEARASLQECR